MTDQGLDQHTPDPLLAVRQRMELFAKVCDAVHHGHQKGIIHRDLKPGNVLVDSHGEVKVIDFGVARGTDSDLALRGDVETIVFKALEKDRDRRYQSAVEFAQDIRRYLSGEAITARRMAGKAEAPRITSARFALAARSVALYDPRAQYEPRVR